jgi:3-methyladenine DNA glycosylase AlkD
MLSEVMAELEALGTEQNRKVYGRHGAGENQFGVSFGNLRKVAKRLKPNNELAEALWATGNQDARILATLVADAKTLDGATLDAWANDVDYYVLADMLASDLIKSGPVAKEKAEAWTASHREYVGQAGWNLVAALAMGKNDLTDEYFEGYLRRIDGEIGGAKNRVRHAMNGALIAIGVRNAALRARAEVVAAKIGRVEVDHGETGCVTPEAIPYIERAWARKKSA